MLEVGPGFSEDHALRDGTIGALAPYPSRRRRRAAAWIEELSSESRYRRFLGGVNQLSDGLVKYLTVVDGQDHVAIVATRPRSDGTEEGVGVARFVRLRDAPTVAEAAITVIDGEQHKGIGWLLAVTLGRAARERGIAHFRGEILADNQAIRQLLGEVGAELHAVGDGCIVFDVALESGTSSAVEDKGKAVTSPLLRAASTWLTGRFRHRVA